MVFLDTFIGNMERSQVFFTHAASYWLSRIGYISTKASWDGIKASERAT